ncbi:transporter substrate-binding domain-containing protein [Photobacterium sp. R1]
MNDRFWSTLMGLCVFNLLVISLCVFSPGSLAYNRPERLLLATQSWFPYQYQENGVMKGPGIEKVKCVMRVMAQPYQLTMTSWDRAQLQTEVGSQHGFFLASHNSKRDEYAVSSEPLAEQKWSWFSLSDSVEFNSSMFKSQVEVAALFGSNKWYWLQKNGYQVTKKPRTPEALLALMLNGDVGAILGNDAVIEQTIQKMGISYRAITRTRVKSQPLGVYFSKAFIQQYPRFLTEFNLAASQCR